VLIAQAVFLLERARTHTHADKVTDSTDHRVSVYTQPFDSLLERVYVTMLDLDSAVADVERGLQVLDNGLDSIESDVVNGRLQLYGTGKVS